MAKASLEVSLELGLGANLATSLCHPQPLKDEVAPGIEQELISFRAV